MVPKHIVGPCPRLSIGQQPVPVAPNRFLIFDKHPRKIWNPLVRPFGHGLMHRDTGIQIIPDAERRLEQLFDELRERTWCDLLRDEDPSERIKLLPSE